jgi:hypothetical protein
MIGFHRPSIETNPNYTFILKKPYLRVKVMHQSGITAKYIHIYNDRVFCQLINNFRFLISFPRENIEFALNYKPENGEKFLVNFKVTKTCLSFELIFDI